MTGSVTVISGPTAVGKGTVVKHLVAQHPDVWVSVSVTTRPARPSEAEGVDYIFVSEREFDDLVTSDGLLEWAQVHGTHRYGTMAAPVRQAVAEGKTVILEIDMQGALQVRERLPECRLVFIAPPSWDDLVERLRGRGTETAQVQQRRLQTARQELATVDLFDDVVVNDDVQNAVDALVGLLRL